MLTPLGRLWIALFLSTVETTIVSTALVSITDALHGFDSRDWIITSYLLTYTGTHTTIRNTTLRFLTERNRISCHLCQVQRCLRQENHDTPCPHSFHNLFNSLWCCQVDGLTVSPCLRLPASLVYVYTDTAPKASYSALSRVWALRESTRWYW